MIKRIVLIFAAVFICIAPAVLANDGGAYPDYNEYITYTVKTDCKEIAIGEKIEFTVTITNHTGAEFNSIHFSNGIFTDSFTNSDKMMEVDRNFTMLEPYSTNKITFSYAVPEYVGWYKKDGNFYIDLCPEIYYLTTEDYFDVEKYGLPYDFFQNMIGVEPIPIKLTNVYDGSHLVNMEIMDDNKHFVYSDRYPADYKESYTYIGEYEGGITNYLSIENISDYTLDVIYIDGYKRDFRSKDRPLILGSKDSIIVENESDTLRMPNEVPEYEHVKYNMLFQDVDGIYFGVTVEKDYKTLVYEIPKIDVIASREEDDAEGNPVYNFILNNVSDKSIEDFFVYYGQSYPETSDELYSNVYNESLGAHSTLSLPEPITIPYQEDRSQEAYSLRIGYWVNNSLCYWKLFIPNIEVETTERYTYEDYAYGIYTEIYHLLNDIELYNLEDTLNQPSTPQIVSTPTPTITPTPIVIVTPAPTVNVGVEATETLKIEDSKSYIIPPWVYIVSLLFGVVVFVILVVYNKRKGETDE